MERNAWILGFSSRRLAVSGAFFLLIATLTFLAIRITADGNLVSALSGRAQRYLIVNHRYVNSVSALWCSCLIGLIAIAFFGSSVLTEGDFFQVVYERASPIVYWGTFATIQGWLALVVGQPSEMRAKFSADRGILLKNLVLILLVIAAIVQWAILFFRLKLFTEIPNWYWLFQPKSGLRIWPMIPLLLGSLLVTSLTLRSSISLWPKALMLTVLGYSLQVGFGYMEGEGLDALRARYVEGGRPIYSWIVTDRNFTMISLTEYEKVYGSDYFLGRRPPGYLLAHAVTNLVANSNSLAGSQEDRFDRLTKLMARIYPLIAVAVVPVMIASGTYLFVNRDSIAPSLMYLFFPNFILMTLQLDQVLFPMLFMVGLYLTLRVVGRESSSLTIIQGAYLFIAVYFSFTLLPLLAIVPVFTMLTFISHRRKEWARRFGRTAMGWALGFGASYLGFRLIAGYDLASRLVNGFALHGGKAGFPSGLQGTLHAIALDTAEIAIWIGFPIVILLLIQAFASITAMFRKSQSKIDLLMVAVLLTLPLIARFTPAGGEVARVGLFFMPVVSFFVVKSLASLMPESNLPVYSFVCYQLISVRLILQNQFPWQ